MPDSYEIEEISQGNPQFSIEEIPSVQNKPSKLGLPDFMRLNMQGKQPLYHPGFPMNIVQGINEGAESGTAAIGGKNTQLPQLPQDEWEKGGREVGRFIGGMAPLTGVAAATALTGGVAGVPAAETLGLGTGAFATTPGTATERGLSTLETLAIPKALKLGVKGIDKLIATPLSNFLEKRGFGEISPTSTISNNIPEMQKQLEQHSQLHQATEEALNEAKRIAKIETGKESPEAMRYEKGQIEQKQSVLPPSTEMKSLEEPYHLEKNLINSNEKLENLNTAIDSTLGKEKQHDVRIARRVFDTLDNERKTLGQAYQSLEKNFEDKNITVAKTKGIEEAMRELSSTLSPGMMETPEGKNLINMVASMETHEVIPANNFLAAMRTARDLARKMREKQFSPGTNAEERIALGEKAKQLEDKYEDVSKTFENSIGEEDSAELKKLSNAWRTRVVPLQRNKVYQKMRFDRRFDWDMIHELRGDVKGNDIIKAAIKSDPETLNLVLGQRYYEKPESMFNPNETAQEYLEHAPQVKKMLDAHKSLTSGIDRLKELKPGVYSKAKEMNEALFKGQEFKRRSELLNKHIDELEKLSREKNISLKEKIRLQSEIKKANISLKEINPENKKNLKDLIGINLGDFVSPYIKVPYKATRGILKYLSDKGEK